MSTYDSNKPYGFVAGDIIPGGVLNKWAQNGNNWFQSRAEGWKKLNIPAFGEGDRQVLMFDNRQGKMGFQVIGTIPDLFINAEGFKEFWDNQLKSKETLLEEAKRRYPVGTTFQCLHLSAKPTIIEESDFKDDGTCIRVHNLKDSGCACIYERVTKRWANIIQPDMDLVKGKWYKYTFDKISYIKYDYTDSGGDYQISERIDSFLNHRIRSACLTKNGKIDKITEKEWEIILLILLKSVKVGDQVKALVNNPSGGAGVNTGEIGIITRYEASAQSHLVDFPNTKGYYIANNTLFGPRYEIIRQSNTVNVLDSDTSRVYQEGLPVLAVGQHKAVFDPIPLKKRELELVNSGKNVEVQIKINKPKTIKIYG